MANPSTRKARSRRTTEAGRASGHPLARVVHRMPGRLRLKFAPVGDRDFYAALEQALAQLPGVESVRVNASAHSAVIAYDPSEHRLFDRIEDHPALKQVLDQAGMLDFAEAATPVVRHGMVYLERHSELAEAIVTGAERLDQRLRTATDGYIDMKVLLPLAAAGFSTLHKARSKGTPMWMTLCTFAFNAFITLHKARIESPAPGTPSAPLTFH